MKTIVTQQPRQLLMSGVDIESKTVEQLLSLKENLVSKIHSNAGRLTTQSSMELDYSLDQLEKIEAELIARQGI